MMKLEGHFVSSLDNIHSAMAKAKYFCTTADIWSGNRRSFLGYTCHWLTETLERKSAALACQRLTGEHSAEKLTQIISNINSSFGLNSSNVVMTVTDNGSNFVKAFKEHGVSPDMDDISDDLPTFDNECLPKHQRCASHTLSLLATTDYLKALKVDASYFYQHNLTLEKCSTLWKKCKLPKSAEEISNVLGKCLIVPVVTRWNSLYDAVCRLLEHKAKIVELCEKLNIPNLISGDLQYLESYRLIMEPIANAIDFLQGQNNIKYGSLIPTLMTLSNRLTKLSKNMELIHLSSIVIQMEIRLRERFQSYFTLDSGANIALAASVLTPDIKLKWLTVLQRTYPEATAEMVSRRVIDTIVASTNKDSFSFELQNSKKKDCPSKMYYDFEDNDDNVVNTTTSPTTGDLNSGVANQFYCYLHDPLVDENSLGKYILLKEMFTKFNTPLPSSAPVERLFSFAGIINSPRRGSLKDLSFEKLVLLKVNAQYYDL